MEMIYVDHAATSPLHPKVLDAMLPYFETHFGNPSSIHQFGRQARQALDQSRRTIAKVLGVSEQTLIFTSGGTEADNMAIIGYALENEDKGKHIITSQVEHHAVLHACKELEKRDFDVTYLPVDETGQVKLNDVQAALRDDTILVTLMFGNNEVGTIQPIEEVALLLKEHQAVFHSDAVQACGAVEFDLSDLSVDMLSISAHKINGPKGIGILYVKEGLKLRPVLFGGEQERKRRAGTENVAAIVGFAKAMELTYQSIVERKERYEQFAQILIDTWTKQDVQFFINGHQNERLPHVLNISFPGVNIEQLLMNLDLAGIAASSGSACTAGSIEPSHVLVAMFQDEDTRIQSAIRFSFGLGNTAEQIERVANETAKIVSRLGQQEEFIN
ncbi:cysteine desulfurase [Alkalihalobacillus sp. MEB130]|uniref:cysteine desulfurase family protein n=1 Tax=Alkalihalobacillus sp. MEB130 TaxID=2976704 RepID=UPI0028DF3AA0|nr:cysteine desulfurase family protein [Alkalihalobacillus sp. MEB130]MDT8861519.1 cysteine desulfurase [Alkalihalobacillus sp. MEB130]